MVLITGGSRGARSINHAMIGVHKHLEREIVIFCFTMLQDPLISGCFERTGKLG